jgi:hypothetical protein
MNESAVMPRRSSHVTVQIETAMIPKSIARSLAWTVFLLVPVGCASEPWNLDRYRDERAVDIEDRLTRDEPIVKNPFGRTNPN